MSPIRYIINNLLPLSPKTSSCVGSPEKSTTKESTAIEKHWLSSLELGCALLFYLAIVFG